MLDVRKHKKLLLFFAMISFFACRISLGKQKDVQASDVEINQVINREEEIEIIPKHKPTGDVKKFLGIWLTSGYNLQPNAYNYTTVDNTIYIYTDQARSLVAALLSPTSWAHYQWYESSDGKTWKEVKKSAGGENSVYKLLRKKWERSIINKEQPGTCF